MSKFSWETYGQQHQRPIESIGFFAALCGFARHLFWLVTEYTRHG